MTPDCEILPTPETLARNIAGFKAKIIERREGELIVSVWDDFKGAWSEPQRVKVEEVREF